MNDLKGLLEIAKSAAEMTGDFLIKEKFHNKKILAEEGRDIKLELDRTAEKLIREKLEPTGINILGEEYGGKISENYNWVVDPIDGTANYFRGIDQCCVSISLMQNKTSLIGVIYNFNTSEMYCSHKDGGAFLNGKKISVSKINEKNKASLTTGFPASESIESSMKFLNDLKGWRKIRMFGSAALSCAYIASGKCDCYLEKGVYLWDIAAGICLVKEAGGCANFNLIDKDKYEVMFSNNLL